jgi:hypothetical protein
VVTGNVTLDPGFGTGGRAAVDLGDAEVVSGIAVQTDDKIPVSDTVGVGSTSNFFVARSVVDDGAECRLGQP